MKLEVWYQSYSGGPHWAVLSVLSKNKRTLARERVRAVSHWRYWRYCPDRSGRYLVRYDTPGGRVQRWVRITV